MSVPWIWLRRFLIAAFSCAFFVHELATSGRIASPFVHEKIYPTLQRLSVPFTDLKFRLRPSRKPKHPIVLVEVDSEAIDKVGRWPWRRDVVAYLIEKTFALGAKIVALDILFSEPEERVPAELVEKLKQRGLAHLVRPFETDPILADAIRRHADQIVVSWMTELPCRPRFTPSLCGQLPPSPLMSTAERMSNLPSIEQASRHRGFVNMFRDPDGVIRKTNLVMMADGKAHPAFSLEVARVALDDELEISLGKGGELEGIRFQRSGRPLRVTPTGLVGLNFRGPRRTFPRLSASAVFDANEPSAGTSELDGAIALIGVSALGLSDIAATPVDETMPGIEVQGTLVDNLMSGDFLVESGAERYPLIALLIILAAMVAGVPLLAWLADRLSAWRALSLLFGAASVLVIADTQILFALHRNWNTGFLYFELASVIVCTLAEKYLLEERRKLRAEGELKTAQLVQSTLLAPPLLDTDLVAVAAHYVPASECGGDIWDARLQGSRLIAWIGDATGHGVSAAIVTAVVKSAFTTLSAPPSGELPGPDQCLSILNRIVHANCRGKMLMTTCFVQLDVETGELLIANAGHESPLLRQGDRVEPLFARGERLGFDLGSEYKLERFLMGPGDSLLLYTDGVYATQSRKGKEWGERALKKRLRNCPTSDALSIRNHLVSGLEEHTRGRKVGQNDDIMFVVLQWKPRTAVGA